MRSASWLYCMGQRGEYGTTARVGGWARLEMRSRSSATAGWCWVSALANMSEADIFIIIIIRKHIYTKFRNDTTYSSGINVWSL